MRQCLPIKSIKHMHSQQQERCRWRLCSTDQNFSSWMPGFQENSMIYQTLLKAIPTSVRHIKCCTCSRCYYGELCVWKNIASSPPLCNRPGWLTHLDCWIHGLYHRSLLDFPPEWNLFMYLWHRILLCLRANYRKQRNKKRTIELLAVSSDLTAVLQTGP